MKSKSYSLLPLLLALLLTACQDPANILPEPQAEPWKAFDAPYLSSKNLNAIPSENNLMVLTEGSLSFISEDHAAFHFGHGVEYGDLPLPYTSTFLTAIGRENLAIDFFSSQMLTNDAARFTLPLADLGSDIAGLPASLWRNQMAANEAGQMIMPFVTTAGEWVLFLFQVETKEDASSGKKWVDKVSAQRISIPSLDHLSFIQSMGDHFLISFLAGGQGYTAKIDSNASFEIVLTELLARRPFPVGNNWYAWGSSNNQLYKSTDGGSSWNMLPLDVNEAGLGDLQLIISFAQIEGKTVVFDPNNIFQVEEHKLFGLTINELDIQDLGNGAIMAIHEWHGKVYAATLSGMYTRDLTDFFSPLVP